LNHDVIMCKYIDGSSAGHSIANDLWTLKSSAAVVQARLWRTPRRGVWHTSWG
jgi:hypothetical protein